MAGWLAHARFIVGALALAFVVAVATPAGAAAQSRQFGQPDRKRGQRRAAPAGSSTSISGRCTHARSEGLHARAAGRPRLARVPPAHAADDRRDRDPRHAGAAGAVLSVPRHGQDRERPLRAHHRTLQCVRALRALDDRDLLHHPRAVAASTSPSASSCCCRCSARKPSPPGRSGAKYAHNYLSFPFTIGVVLILLMWIAGNIPNRVDVEWIKRGGGMVGNDHPPAYRFNAGQKLIYWIVVIGGWPRRVTGYLLMFPFYATDIAGMQLAQIVHGTVGVLFIAAMLGSHLHRHHRHGGRLRGDGDGRRRRELGQAASRALARTGAGPHRSRPIAGPAARHTRGIVSAGLANSGARRAPAGRLLIGITLQDCARPVILRCEPAGRASKDRRPAKLSPQKLWAAVHPSRLPRLRRVRTSG